MSDIEEKPRPGLRFLWLAIVTAILLGIVAAGVIWSDATTTPKLALDLEGGTSIILEPQVSEDTNISKEQLDQAVSIIRQRVDSTGVSEAEITTQGDRNIVVNLPGNPDEETRNLVRSSAQLVFRRVALVGDPRSQEKMQQEEQGNGEEDPSKGLSDEEKKRLEDLTGGDQEGAQQQNGQADASAPQGGGSVVNSGTGPDSADNVSNAGSSASSDAVANSDSENTDSENSDSKDPAQAGGKVPGPAAKDAAGSGEEGTEGAGAEAEGAEQEGTGSGSKVDDSTPRPLFDPEKDTAAWQSEDIIADYTTLDCTDPKNRTGGQQQPADQPVVSCAQDGSAKYILGPVELSGDHLADATFGYAQGANGVQTNQPAVNLKFDDAGREIFKQITSTITGLQQPYNQFAITLDGLVLSAPTSNAVITDGNAEISGNFTLEEAQTLANQLKNGSLPLSFQVQSEEQISPTLGANYLSIGLLTGLVGLILVVIYSLLQYRVLGLVTVSSLVVAGVITYLLLLLVSWRYGYRLSLAGVAGIIIGIGMAADSFIVYFERVRDELRSGRSLLSAVEVGWDRAKRTIYASKAVNMLAAVILYILAVGSVRGFAFTLGLTVIVDVLVVFLFTHPMLEVLSRTKFFGQGHPMSGMDPRLLGVKPAAYRGALNVDLDENLKSPEAKRREKARARKAGMTSAEVDASRDTSSASVETTEAKGSSGSMHTAKNSRGSGRGAKRSNTERDSDTAAGSTTTIDDPSESNDSVSNAGNDGGTASDLIYSSDQSDSSTGTETSEAPAIKTRGERAAKTAQRSKARSGGSIAERKAAAKRAAENGADSGEETEK